MEMFRRAFDHHHMAAQWLANVWGINVDLNAQNQLLKEQLGGMGYRDEGLIAENNRLQAQVDLLQNQSKRLTVDKAIKTEVLAVEGCTVDDISTMVS